MGENLHFMLYLLLFAITVITQLVFFSHESIAYVSFVLPTQNRWRPYTCNCFYDVIFYVFADLLLMMMMTMMAGRDDDGARVRSIDTAGHKAIHTNDNICKIVDCCLVCSFSSSHGIQMDIIFIWQSTIQWTFWKKTYIKDRLQLIHFANNY